MREDGGLSPRIMEAEGLVLSNLSAVVDLPGTRLVADLGHRKTTFCLVSDGRGVAARTIPLAGAALTEAIAADRVLSLDVGYGAGAQWRTPAA